MSRITVMLEDGIEQQLRSIQAKKIKDTNSNFSFSACVNEILERGLK